MCTTPVVHLMCEGLGISSNFAKLEGPLANVLIRTYIVHIKEYATNEPDDPLGNLEISNQSAEKLIPNVLYNFIAWIITGSNCTFDDSTSKINFVK